jgi:uncharacterized protein (TIGR02611 family)
MIKTLQQAKRLLKILFGFTLLILGGIMIFTPGPGWITILLGLGILGAEYVWAQRLLDRVKHQGGRIRDSIFNRDKPTVSKTAVAVSTREPVSTGGRDAETAETAAEVPAAQIH